MTDLQQELLALADKMDDDSFDTRLLSEVENAQIVAALRSLAREASKGEAVAKMIEVCKNPPEPSEALMAMVREYARFSLPAPPAPEATWEDPRVQTVYGLVCDGTEPPEGEHWEGFLARRIVAALYPPAMPAEAAKREPMSHRRRKQYGLMGIWIASPEDGGPPYPDGET